jgi:hypothetical protein
MGIMLILFLHLHLHHLNTTTFLLIWHSSWLHFLPFHRLGEAGAEAGAGEEEGEEAQVMQLLLMAQMLHFFML